MTRWLATVVLAACAATSSRGALPEVPTPAPSRTNDAVAKRTAQIDAVMLRWAKTDSPGCAVAVIQHGEIVHAKGYGMADLEHGVPITPETVFDIGSISKQFTAAAILLAAADGKLGLDDDVRVHVPALPRLGKSPMTIRQLLHHTGGLRDYGTLLILGGTREDGIATVRETIDVLARQRGLDFEPGTRHIYSNTGYFVLAQAVEHATGQSLAARLHAKIFAPLGMTKTQVLDDPKRLVRDRAIGYAPRDAGWKIAMSGWEQTGDGAVLTTVLDLAKWDANFYAPKVGGQPLVDGLLTRGELADGTQLDYAAGLVHGQYRGQPTVWHNGAWVGYRAQLERFPALETTIAVLCNAASAQPEELAHRIADIVLEEHLRSEPTQSPSVRLTTAELDNWVATYREVGAGPFIRIERKDDALELRANGEHAALVPTSARVVRLVGPTRIVAELDGTRPRRTITVTGPSFEAEFAEIDFHRPTAPELTARTGRYRSEEIGTEWTLSVSDGALIATGRGLEGPIALTAVAEDEYVHSPRRDDSIDSIMALGGTFEFTRDKRGRIDGFLLAIGHTHGVRFARVP